MKKTVSYSVIIILFPILFYIAGQGSNGDGYTATIVSFIENASYIEYPQIEGLKDQEKQGTINQLLKDQIYVGAKDYRGNPFVSFDNPEYIYNFKSGIGFTNEHIASFYLSFDSYGTQLYYEEFGGMATAHRFYGITINMATGEKIELSDFIEIDERLIYSDDGSGLTTDYNSAINPLFHTFKDAFSIYATDDEKDEYHWRTVQETIDSLKDPDTETQWYIDENRNIVFVFSENGISIPFTELSNTIYPEYLAILER